MRIKIQRATSQTVCPARLQADSGAADLRNKIRRCESVFSTVAAPGGLEVAELDSQ